MIEYVIQDIDGNDFNLSTDAGFDTIAKNSLTYGSDDFAWENKIANRSFLSGALKVGADRIEPRSLSFSYTRAVGEDSGAYRTDENTLMQWLSKAYYLIDNTNAMRVRVTPQTHSPIYDPGGHKVSGTGTFSLLLLSPFWESTTPGAVSSSLLAATPVTLTPTNSGYTTVPVVITLSASVPVASIQIYVNETRDGIEITEDIFGTSGFTIAVIDCVNGTYTIADLDRRSKISAGTGFFELPVGVSSVIAETDAPCDIVVSWNERYFI